MMLPLCRVLSKFGFDATANSILPVPSGVVWTAWEKFFQIEPWENLESHPRTAPTLVLLAVVSHKTIGTTGWDVIITS